METKKINSNDLLDKILTASKEYAQQGKSYAEEALNIPESGEERQNKLDGLKKGAIATAVLVGLLGTKGGRALTGKAIKLGGIAALGTVAYKGYKNWRAKAEDVSIPVHQLEGDEAQRRAMLLIATMVSAANADGKLDDDESALLKREILGMKLPKSLFGEVSQIVEQPLSALELSKKVNNQAVASEVYIAARLFIDSESSAAEQSYLNELVIGLGLDEELVAALEAELN
ncbi:MAG: tellurite resistance TerB family protein [Acidiferrobacterales bacterium]|nr:tellurite resistance TerB family protein [Acidiferrobacterales bacterium]